MTLALSEASEAMQANRDSPGNLILTKWVFKGCLNKREPSEGCLNKREPSEPCCTIYSCASFLELYVFISSITISYDQINGGRRSLY
jgi:hypothetical protein